MDTDFEIEILDQEPEEAQEACLPVNFLSFGEIARDDVNVYIKQDVYKALEKLAASDTSKELGSILIGDYVEELGKVNVIISGYVEAKYTDASSSTLTFTHETWEYVHAQHEKKFPDRKIIGWQHTHPNYGIFLSNYDMFIQENFFNLPFQVAYVIDPVQNIRGFFQWKDGKVEKLQGYYVYDEVGKPIKIEQTKAKEKTAEPAKLSKWTTGLMAVLCVLTVVLTFCTMSLSSKYTHQLEKQAQLQQDLENQSALIQNQAATLAQLQSQAMGDMHGCYQVKFLAYTVVEGDTLTKICENHNLDYRANIKTILAVNGIQNPSSIYVGQIILLPIAQ